MPVRLATLVAMSVLALAGCNQPIPSGDNSVVLVRLYGDGKVGQACEAQSECGFQQRCAYRGEDIQCKSFVLAKGVCEVARWPGGCFGLLPMTRFSAAEIAEMKRDGQDGLPIRVICE